MQLFSLDISLSGDFVLQSKILIVESYLPLDLTGLGSR